MKIWSKIQFWFLVTGNGAGNEATQLLRQMITCRSLGLPIPSALNINRNINDQPIALVKVSAIQRTHTFELGFSINTLN